MRAMIVALCLAAALAAPTEAKGIAETSSKPENKDKRPQPFKALTGAFYALSVPNMAESVNWYTEKFGLTVVFEVHTGTEVTVLEGGGLLVELIRDPSAHPPSPPGPGTHGIFKAGFMVKDFDKTVEEIRARGITIAFGPFPANGPQRANLIIRDNAGNLIQIFGD